MTVLNINTKEFKHSLKQCIEFAPTEDTTEDTRYSLQGIYIERKYDNTITFTATDGHRLINKEVRCVTTEDFKPFILTSADIKNILKIITVKRGQFSSIRKTDELINIQLGSFEYVCKEAEGTYPDYRRVIPEISKDTKRSGLDSSHVIDALAALGSESVDIIFNGTEEPHLLTSVDNKTKCVIMPIRTFV